MIKIKSLFIILCFSVISLASAKEDIVLDYPFVQYNLSESVHDIVLSPDGKYIYLNYKNFGFSIIDIQNPNAPFYILEKYSFNNRFSNNQRVIESIIPSSNGEKLYLGMSDGLTILDISNPENILEIGHFSNEFVQSVVLSSDENTVYMNGKDDRKEGEIIAASGLIVLDISEPSNIKKIGFYETSSIKDMVLSQNGQFLYLVSSYTFAPSFEILNVVNPSQPTLISSLFDKVGEFATNIVLSEDGTKVYIAKSTETVIAEFELRETYLSIVNIENSSKPKEIVTVKREYSSYGMHFSPNQKRLYFGNLSKGLGIMSVLNNQPINIGYVDTDDNVFGFDISLDGTLAYVANHANGFVIMDISDNELDSDNDGISDIREKELGLNPNSIDSDADGILDNEEIGNINNPRDTDNDGIIDALDTDSDNDGISDKDEVKAGTSPTDKDDYPRTALNEQKKAIFMILMNRSKQLSKEVGEYYRSKIPTIMMIEALKKENEKNND